MSSLRVAAPSPSPSPLYTEPWDSQWNKCVHGHRGEQPCQVRADATEGWEYNCGCGLEKSGRARIHPGWELVESKAKENKSDDLKKEFFGQMSQCVYRDSRSVWMKLAKWPCTTVVSHCDVLFIAGLSDGGSVDSRGVRPMDQHPLESIPGFLTDGQARSRVYTRILNRWTSML